MSDHFHESKVDSDVEKDFASHTDSLAGHYPTLPKGYRWGVEARGTSTFPFVAIRPPSPRP